MKVRQRWRRALGLAWPIVAEQEFSTLMRTVDVFVSGFFSPATIVAVELANLYAGFVRRLGNGLGSGVVAVTSQETGAGRTTNRNDAVTQALLLGAGLGIPFTGLGFVLGERLLALLGASAEATTLGAVYLAVVFAVAPARIIGIVAKRVLHGMGDTRTPMYTNVTANVINILVTVGLGLGVGPVPRLGVLGIASGTALANVFVALVLVGAIVGPGSPVRIVRPRNLRIGTQIVTIGAPSTAKELTTQGARFPFNAVLLMFGTPVAAAYYVSRRVYQQVVEPVSRGYRDTTKVMVGQSIGERNRQGAYRDGVSLSALGFVTVSLIGIALFGLAEPLVGLFTADPETVPYAVTFLQVFAISAPFALLTRTFSASLAGGSETRVPLVATLTGRLGITVGFSFLVGVVLQYGVPAVYVALVLTQLWSGAIVGVWFYRRTWLDRAIGMMDDRAESGDAA